MIQKEKIFITAKTYPTRSSTYQELVCTAGITESGNWVRLYPIPYRKLYKGSQFKKYTWIEAELEKPYGDHRVESKRINVSSIEILEHIGTENGWAERKDLILKKTIIHENLRQIIDMAQKENSLSLCTFKPKEYLGVKIVKKNESRGLSPMERKKFINANRSLFDEEDSAVDFIHMPEVPYRFKLSFLDSNNKESNLSIIDWEIPQLYLNLLKYEGSEKIAVQKVEQKLNNFIEEKDLYLFLGTMRAMHSHSKNPYTIIGLFYPPVAKYYQPSLF